MTKHRTSRRRRSQKGGLFGFFESPDPNAPPKQGWGSWFSGKTSTASGALTDVTNSVTQGASNVGSSIKSILDSDLDLTGPTEAPYVATVPTEAPSGPTEAPYGAMGGRPYVATVGPTEAPSGPTETPSGAMGGRRKRKMKGGKGGLGLTYYATPVSGLNVAKPTYWIQNQSMNGGSRRKRRQRKSRKSRKSKKSKKTRRH